jgi:hypothetical protein
LLRGKISPLGGVRLHTRLQSAAIRGKHKPLPKGCPSTSKRLLCIVAAQP